MPTIAGLRGTGSFGPNERPQNFRELILFLNPNGSAPLFALTSKAKTETTDDPVFHWWEETIEPVRVALLASAAAAPPAAPAAAPPGLPASTAGATNFLMIQGDPTAPAGTPGTGLVVPGDLLVVESNVRAAAAGGGQVEVLLVTAIDPATGVVTVQRGFGLAAGTPVAAIPAPAAGQPPLQLLRIGTSFPEGAGAPQSASTNPVEFVNFTQIFRKTYQITNTARVTRYRTGDPLRNEKKRKAFHHASDIEHALLFGMPSQTTGANGQPQRTTGGLMWFVRTNRTTFGAANPLTLQSFMDAIAPVFDYDTPAGNERIVYCGNVALNAINRLVASSPNTMFRYDGTVRVYGQELNKFILPQGTIYLKTHPLMNINPSFSDWMFVVDPTGIIWRPMAGRDTRTRDNIQPPDADYLMGEWLTEGGFEFHHERAFAILNGLR